MGHRITLNISPLHVSLFHLFFPARFKLAENGCQWDLLAVSYTRNQFARATHFVCFMFTFIYFPSTYKWVWMKISCATQDEPRVQVKRLGQNGLIEAHPASKTSCPLAVEWFLQLSYCLLFQMFIQYLSTKKRAHFSYGIHSQVVYVMGNSCIFLPSTVLNSLYKLLNQLVTQHHARQIIFLN